MTDTHRSHVLVVGAGSTGAALAHDLALRGLRVTVVERGEIASGTTGHNHCLLHSGGRYCVTDPATAGECARENVILRRIMPGLLEKNGGLFVALEEADLAYKDRFLAGCAASGIPAEEIPPERALALEPGLRRGILAAILVDDAVFEPYRFCRAFLATACKNGAAVRTFCAVRDLLRTGSAVTGATVWDARSGKEEALPADLVVNAAGPWSGRIGEMAGVGVPLAPTAGVLVTVSGRLTRRVIHRLHEPADGDILVPIRNSTIAGTTSWPVADADSVPIPEDHILRMMKSGERMLPDFLSAPKRGVMTGVRPLLVQPAGAWREAGRTFACLDHAAEGAENLISVIGGKTTTSRLMAERAADLVCGRLGIRAVCRTATTILEDWRLM